MPIPTNKETYTNARLDDLNAKILTLIQLVESQSYAIDYLINKYVETRPKKYKHKHKYNRTAQDTYKNNNMGSYIIHERNEMSDSLSSSDTDSNGNSSPIYACKAELSYISPKIPQTQVSNIFPPVHTVIKKIENLKKKYNKPQPISNLVHSCK